MPYVKNPRGHIHSVTEEHIEALKVGHKSQPRDAWTLPAGWAEVSEAEAREWAAKENVNLFVDSPAPKKAARD